MNAYIQRVCSLTVTIMATCFPLLTECACSGPSEAVQEVSGPEAPNPYNGGQKPFLGHPGSISGYEWVDPLDGGEYGHTDLQDAGPDER